MLRRLRARVFTPGAVVLVGVVIACAYLFDQARRLYFFGDDYEFLLQRHLSWGALMRPHSEHWSTLPIIAFRIMVAIFGIGHYPAYALMPILLHAACCGLLYAVMRANGVGGWPAAVVVIPFAFLCGDTGENPLWDFQIGFLGSATFGLLALLLLSTASASASEAAHEDRAGRMAAGRTRLVLTWAALVGAFLCSGMAIPMLAWAGLYVLLTRGLPRALLVTVPPGLVYVVWFIAYGHQGSAADKRGTGQQYISFVTTGLGTLWDRVDRFSGSGAVVLAALLAVAWLGRSAVVATRALALSGVLATLFLFLFLGVSRSGYGADGATASRYAWFGIAFCLPAAALACATVARRLGSRRVEALVAGLLVAVLLIGNGVVQTRTYLASRRALVADGRAALPATEQLLDEHAAFLNQMPSPQYNPNITVDDVRQALARGQLHRRPASAAAVLDAAVQLQVAAGTTDFGLPPATGLHAGRLTGRLNRSGCSVLRSTGPTSFLDLPPTSTGSQVQVTSDVTRYPVRLVQGSRVSEGASLSVPAGRPTYVATTSAHATLRIMVEPGPVTVCLLGAS